MNEQLKWIICTKEGVRVQYLYRERFNGKLLEIQSELLLFSIEETRALLLCLGFGIGEKDIDVIHTCTEGWAAGLRLLGVLVGFLPAAVY